MSSMFRLSYYYYHRCGKCKHHNHVIFDISSVFYPPIKTREGPAYQITAFQVLHKYYHIIKIPNLYVIDVSRFQGFNCFSCVQFIPLDLTKEELMVIAGTFRLQITV